MPKTHRKLKRRTKRGGGWHPSSWKRPAWFTRMFTRNQARKPGRLSHRTPPSETLCESDECLLLGIQREQYISYFNNFKLDNAPDVKVSSFNAGNSVSNGRHRTHNFVAVGVYFKKSNYGAYAVLKQIKGANDANLLYEYRVGTFLNVFCSILPSFVYTYGIYTGPEFPQDEQIDITKYKHAGHRMKDPCNDAEKLSLLTQWVSNTKILRSDRYHLQRHGSIYEIMFQIYYTFACMHQFGFKHNNLLDNIYLVRFPKPILFQYTLKDGKVFQFTCHHIAKILEYGQCTYENTKRDLAEFSESCKKEIQLVEHTRDTFLFENLMEPAVFMSYFNGDRTPKDPSLKDLLEFVQEKIELNQALDRAEKPPTPLGTLIVDGYARQNMKFIRF
jgi:hypothetical protein